MGNWNERHGTVLSALINEFNNCGIRYFILRNYEGLPNRNSSKDVDIIVDPNRKKDANRIIKQVYSAYGFTHFYLARFTYVYCWHAMDVTNHLSIHIDLIYGYRMKGYEVFSFEELYAQTKDYKSFKVLNDYYEGLMVFIYKQFGYKKPVLKKEYQDIIGGLLANHPSFAHDLQKLVGQRIADDVIRCINNRDFDKMLLKSGDLTEALKYYCLKKNPVVTLFRIVYFYLLKLDRMILHRRRYIKSLSVMAPDGAGKTTFLNALTDEIGFYFTKDSSFCSIWHFRPEILPNLGAVGNKTGMMKPDTNFNNPHRAKPAGFFSSLFRISYYWLDYVIGWYVRTFNDILFDRFTIFDRYSYDLIVDPHRTRLNLPDWLRTLYVRVMPKPRLSFYLDVNPDEIFRRKQELLPDEISRQVGAYRKLVSANKRILTLDGNESVDKIVEKAILSILNTFATKF